MEMTSGSDFPVFIFVLSFAADKKDKRDKSDKSELGNHDLTVGRVERSKNEICLQTQSFLVVLWYIEVEGKKVFRIRTYFAGWNSAGVYNLPFISILVFIKKLGIVIPVECSRPVDSTSIPHPVVLTDLRPGSLRDGNSS